MAARRPRTAAPVRRPPDGPGSVPPRRAVLVLAAAAAALLLGSGLTVATDPPASDVFYRDVVRAIGRAPHWGGTAAEVVGEAGILLLGLVFSVLLWRAVRRGVRAGSSAVLAGAGVVVAYLTSEGAKLLAAQPRPCASSALATVAQCPGDWSLPSNHATIAGALTVAVLLTVPRWGLVTVPVALAVAAARVAVGVHYPHDVLTGLLWGAVVVAGMVLVLAGPTQRAGHAAVSRWTARRGADAGSARPPR